MRYAMRNKIRIDSQGTCGKRSAENHMLRHSPLPQLAISVITAHFLQLSLSVIISSPWLLRGLPLEYAQQQYHHQWLYEITIVGNKIPVDSNSG